MELGSQDYIDLEPKSTSILKEVLTGLSKNQKTLSPKLLYDKKGSELFERICKLEEYYPTRAEVEILQNFSGDIGKTIGSDALIIEPGSGSSEKISILLPSLEAPKGYIPIEISKEILLTASARIKNEFETLMTMPICADFDQEACFPMEEEYRDKKCVVFFPGSTIGNYNPDEAVSFLKKCSHLIKCGKGGILIGVDLKKDPVLFQKAYDDSQGVTAKFNLNLLDRLNRETGANFDTKHFYHKAKYNNKLSRVEMHLVSNRPQLVKVHETLFYFHQDESIHTENSYKYSEEEFCKLASKAKLKLLKSWKDNKNLFCVYYFVNE